MAKNFSDNYSKWDRIELSDDESDLHPNIDKDSWFRLKHRTRLEREEREDAEVKMFTKENAENQSRLAIIRARLSKLKSGVAATEGDDGAEFEDVDALVGEADELEKQIAQRNKRIAEINERRKWNIDNICRVSEEKTIVNELKTTSLRADDFKPTGATERTFGELEDADSSKVKSKDAAAEALAAVVPKAEQQAQPPAPPAAAASSSGTASISTSSSSNNGSGSGSGNGNGNGKSSSAAVPASSTSTSNVPPPAVAATKSAGPAESSSTAIVQGPAVTGSASRERFAVVSYNDFVLGHEVVLEAYSEIRDLEQTKEYLFKHCDVLLHEHGQSYLLLSCLEDEMNGKRARMKHVCRQSQILSHITELAVSMKRDPRDMVLPFFKRISEAEYMTGFTTSVTEFTERIVKRAVEKRKEMDAEEAEEMDEDSVPLGPGGLNPFKVLASLPQSMKDAFESQDIARLHKVLADMPPTDAKHYMKLCVDSGLWVAKDSSIFEGDGDDLH